MLPELQSSSVRLPVHGVRRGCMTEPVGEDTVFNHMTGRDSGTGVAGSNYTHYDYPGIYQDQVAIPCRSGPSYQLTFISIQPY
jgi:hypothetical protein